MSFPSDPEDWPELIFERLFDYAPTFICARNHRLAERPFITAEDFAKETLVTYPVERKEAGYVQPVPDHQPGKSRGQCAR